MVYEGNYTFSETLAPGDYRFEIVAGTGLNGNTAFLSSGTDVVFLNYSFSNPVDILFGCASRHWVDTYAYSATVGADNPAPLDVCEFVGELYQSASIPDSFASARSNINFGPESGSVSLRTHGAEPKTTEAPIGSATLAKAEAHLMFNFTVTTETVLSFEVVLYRLRDDSSSGSNQNNPTLPSTFVNGDYGYIDEKGNQWFCPYVASGFEYTMTSGSLFTYILDFPTGIDDDDLFEVFVDSNSLGEYGPGESVDFTGYPGGGVESFTIRGIRAPVDALSPVSFPLKLDFNTATADFTMSPIEAFCDNYEFPIPEGDLTGDCIVNLKDLAEAGKAWMTTYDFMTLLEIVNNWLTCDDPQTCF